MESQLILVNFIFLYFPAKFFEFSFNPWCKIGWLPGHLDRVFWRIFYKKLFVQDSKHFWGRAPIKIFKSLVSYELLIMTDLCTDLICRRKIDICVYQKKFQNNFKEKKQSCYKIKFKVLHLPTYYPHLLN